MTFLIAIEGADGAGKATAAANVRDMLIAKGLTAAVVSVPRYDRTAGGIALGEFLSGRLPVPLTPKAVAALYALDRLESLQFVSAISSDNDVVVFDRYIASNMVYQASKVDSSEAKAFMEWIYRLEVETFGIAPPDLSIYLDTPFEIARDLMIRKNQRSYTDRKFDEHEADDQLQIAVRRNYMLIAEMNLAGPWQVVETTTERGLKLPCEIAAEVTVRILERLSAMAQPICG